LQGFFRWLAGAAAGGALAQQGRVLQQAALG